MVCLHTADVPFSLRISASLRSAVIGGISSNVIASNGATVVQYEYAVRWRYRGWPDEKARKGISLARR